MSSAAPSSVTTTDDLDLGTFRVCEGPAMSQEERTAELRERFAADVSAFDCGDDYARFTGDY